MTASKNKQKLDLKASVLDKESKSDQANKDPQDPKELHTLHVWIEEDGWEVEGLQLQNSFSLFFIYVDDFCTSLFLSMVSVHFTTPSPDNTGTVSLIWHRLCCTVV